MAKKRTASDRVKEGKAISKKNRKTVQDYFKKRDRKSKRGK
mgnify:CR=1 FL=1